MRHTRIMVSHYGGPDELRVVEEECPEPKAGEVRVRVLAAGVCLPDLLMREGVHPETPRLPFTPGRDLVGVAERLGDGVSFRRGRYPDRLPARAGASLETGAA
jgi:NADPH:quinone reductase